MGSSSDWETLRHAAETLDGFQVPHERRVVSPTACPTTCLPLPTGGGARAAAIIAGAGGAAHLPGMLAAKTMVPVLGVPVASKHLQGVDSLYSIVQMPKGMSRWPPSPSARPAPPTRRSVRGGHAGRHDDRPAPAPERIPGTTDRRGPRHDAGPAVKRATRQIRRLGRHP
jgi:hypothetical protein